jgi:hypothetical protein
MIHDKQRNCRVVTQILQIEQALLYQGRTHAKFKSKILPWGHIYLILLEQQMWLDLPTMATIEVVNGIFYIYKRK